MMSGFGGYVGVGDCPLDTTAYLYTQSSPYDMGDVYDGAYNGEWFHLKKTSAPAFRFMPRPLRVRPFHATRLGEIRLHRYPDVV